MKKLDHRLKYLDISKGIGMTMIVWIHICGNLAQCLPPPVLRINGIITTIYVPLFFVLSGYFLNIETIDLKISLKNKVASLLKPFIVVYLFSFIISFILSCLGFSAKHEFSWSNFFLPVFSKTFFNGPIWFLLSMFWTFSFLFLLIKVCNKNNRLIVFFSIIIGFIGFYLGKLGIIIPFFMGASLVACPLVMMGYCIRKYISKYLLNSRCMDICGCLIGFFILILCGNSLSMQNNSYGGFYLSFLFSILGGSISVLCFSIMIEKYGDFFAYWGKYSLIVLCLHNFILIPITQVVSRFLAQPLLCTTISFVLIYLIFLIVIPLVCKFSPSIFNIKR